MKQYLLLVLLILCKANNNDELNQITLMSYNIMFVPRLLVFKRDQITRAYLMTKAKFLRSTDILSLQEVFQPRPSRIVLKSLAKTYSYRTPILGSKKNDDYWNETWNRHIGRGLLKFISGGLIILSKWPIVYAVQYFYQHSCGGHMFVRVGFIYTRILYGKNKHQIHVIATHLQPSDHHGCYLSSEEETREKQMQEIDDFIKAQNISNTELVFFLGDFNIDKYNVEQYETMIDILHVKKQYLHPSSIPCTWDSTFNIMTNFKHQENQMLDYVFIHRDHLLKNSQWLNLIIDPMASEQWHLLGRNRMFHNTRNIPLLELSDHYPVIGLFNSNKQKWPERPFGILTYVKFVTADGNLPIVITDRNIRIGNSTNETSSVFILTNNGTPRRHRCLKSEQFIVLIDGHRPEFYLSDAKYFQMKYGMEQVNRYLKIIQIDNKSKCIKMNSTFILQTRSSKGFNYVSQISSHLCSCTKHRNQAQLFRLIEVKRKNINCVITHGR